MAKKSVLALCFLLFSAPAFARASLWSVGLGYHNPPGATVGLNFMHLWSHVAFEAGIGYIGTGETGTQKMIGAKACSRSRAI